MSTTPTAVDDAVGNDDERVCGQWRDQWDNEYVVTRCQSSYSVVVRYLQRCKKQGTTQTFEGIINRDTNGQYTWGNPTISHELHIRDETVLEWRAKPKGTKKDWIWSRIRRPRVQFDAQEKTWNVTMCELQQRLAECLRSPLTHPSCLSQQQRNSCG